MDKSVPSPSCFHFSSFLDFSFTHTLTVASSNTARFSQLEEMSLSSPSPSASVTTMPVRKAKHKGRRTNSSSPKKSKELANRGTFLTEEEVRQHVTAQYVHGPGGTLRASTAKRHQQQGQRELEHIAQLQRLDQHPALVLNADYQVRGLYFVSIDCLVLYPAVVQVRNRLVAHFSSSHRCSQLASFLSACGIGKKPSRQSLAARSQLWRCIPM